MYLHRERLGPADLAFTDRHGGVSAAPFDSLNLAITGADEAGARAENLRRVLDDFAPGAGLVDLHQVHGDRVVVAEEPSSGPRPEADGVVTDRPDLVLLVRAADCVPVLLADPAAGVVGAAHAGRPGLAAGVVLRTVQAMRDLGASSLTAWVGPHVCGACYEVPEAMREQVAALEPASRATTSWGTPALDIGAGVRAQLVRSGVQVVDVAGCTRESEDLYSYRRDGEGAGRLAGLIRLHAPGATPGGAP